MRQSAYGIADNNPPVIENLLKLNRGLAALACCEISLTPHIDRIEGSEESLYAASWFGQLIWSGDLQQFNRFGRLATVQRQKAPKRRQVTESDGRVLGELFFQIICQ